MDRLGRPEHGGGLHVREHDMLTEGVGVDEMRTAGWYPDPWGTDGERYFDGSAWGREARTVGAVDAGTGNGSPGESGVAPSPVPSPVPDRGAVDTEIPAGWHPDPWGLAALRWWDGAAWSEHTSGPPATGPVDVVAERSLARWVQPALLAGGVAQAVALVASVPQVQWLVDHWDALTEPGANRPQMPRSTSADLAQVGFLVGIVVGVLFLVWFYRAASTGWASGLPARRRPMLSTLSFIIPVINLWWPYQAMLDMVPADDRRRMVIRWWWVLWLAGTFAGLMIYPVAALSNEATARGVAIVGAVAMVGAAFLARAVVEYVTSTHEQLAGAASATS